MENPFYNREIVELNDSDNETEIKSKVILEDFLTNEELDIARNTINEISSSATASPLQHQHLPPDLPLSYNECLGRLLEVFPDISHDHAKSLYEARRAPNADLQYDLGRDLAQGLIMQVLDSGDYPKERERLNELKRKRSTVTTSDDERVAKWRNTKREGTSPRIYADQAKKLIQRDFLTTPIRFIDKIFQEHNHLYAAYLAIDLAEQTYDSSKPKPYAKLKKLRRRGGHPSYSSSDTPGPSAAPFTVAADADHMAMELQMELQAARLQRQKLQIQRQIQKDAAAAEAAQEQEHRDNGDVLECQCCFDDDVPINKITHCDGDDNHFFCFSCAQNNASNEIGLGRHQLLCMDGSGCKAHFSPAERRRFLEPKLLEKLERSEQQAQLKEANLENLDSCPFCDFAAICSPKDIDREFRCQNPECELVSCRLCRSSTHIPMSCEEYQKENGHSKRHEVEESMSAAVIRQCPRCKTATIKEEGCNKVSCTCGAMICDFCGKDITKEGYNHFSDGARGLRLSDAKKCPTYDDTHARNEKRVDQAEKGALEKVRLENPNLSEEDLKIKFSGSVQKRVGGRGAERFERDYQRIRGRGPPPPLPPFPHFILDRPYRHGVLANHALDNNAQHAALGQPNAMVEGIAYGENERRIGRMIDQRTQELQQRLQEQLEQSLEQQRQRQELQQQQHLQLQQQQARHRQYIHQQQARQAEVRAEKLAGQREREIALPYMPEWRRAREQGARDERGRYHHPLPWGYGNILGQDEGLFVGEGEGGGVPPYEPMIRRPWE